MQIITPLFILALVLLQSCASPPLAPVSERKTLSLKAEMDDVGGTLIRIAQPGDTLYSIAFELGLDANKVAAWNGLADTSKLLVGQRVRLTKPIGFKIRRDVSRVTPIKAGAQNSRKVIKAKQTQKGSNVAVSNASQKARKKSTKGLSDWQWPTEGKVVSKYSPSTGKQGIDILGRKGQNVVSANAGEVVYVGNALKGYGNLVIIKHDAQFLTAYAFNQEILVKEGQTVEKNRLIARMGLDKTRRSVLHFQVRGYGKALDPLKFLSKR